MFRNIKKERKNKRYWEETTSDIEKSECDGFLGGTWGSYLLIFFGGIRSKASDEKKMGRMCWRYEDREDGVK